MKKSLFLGAVTALALSACGGGFEPAVESADGRTEEVAAPDEQVVAEQAMHAGPCYFSYSYCSTTGRRFNVFYCNGQKDVRNTGYRCG